MWQKILNLINSDLYFYICLTVGTVSLLLYIVGSILLRIQKRRKDEEFLALLRKYGIPDDYVCPENVGQYISHLIYICEECNFDSLREAQNVYEDRYFGVLKIESISECSKLPESED